MAREAGSVLADLITLTCILDANSVLYEKQLNTPFTAFFQVLATSGCKSIKTRPEIQSETRVQNFYNLIGWHSFHSCNWLLQKFRKTIISVNQQMTLHFTGETRYTGPSRSKLKPHLLPVTFLTYAILTYN